MTAQSVVVAYVLVATDIHQLLGREERREEETEKGQEWEREV